MEGVAGGRLHDLREQIIGEAAEDIADEAGTALRFFERIHRDAIGLAADQDGTGAREGRGVAAADDPADRAFAADRGDLAPMRPPGSSTTIEIMVSPSGKTLEWTCSPRVRTMSPGFSADELADELEQGTGFVANVDSRRLPVKAARSVFPSMALEAVERLQAGLQRHCALHGVEPKRLTSSVSVDPHCGQVRLS